MSFEYDLAQLNEHFFFKEFSYSKTTFRPTPQGEVELADHILWLDDFAVVFQLKERNSSIAGNAESEERWFERKVLGVGTRQIRDTLRYLDTNDVIDLANHRGDVFALEKSKLRTIHNLICYVPSEQLPSGCRSKKFYKSRNSQR